MANVVSNGLHWCSPVFNPGNTTAQKVYNNIGANGGFTGPGFSGALIIADTGLPGGGGPNDWAPMARWIKNNARRTSETVLRLYWPCANTNCNPDTPGPCNLPGTGPELADIYYDLIVDKAVRRFGIRNFQVLNELNFEYETTCGTRTTIGGYMYNLAYHLKRRAVQAGTYPIYLGFPGPGGSKFSDANWGPYWNDYKTFITRPLDFVADFAYNWLAVHVYGISEAECEQNLIGAYDDLRVRIPQYPHRYTEWSIPNDVPNRAGAMVAALRSFRNHVLNQNDVDVYALHAYISRISDPGSGGDRYGLTPGGGGQVAGVF